MKSYLKVIVPLLLAVLLLASCTQTPPADTDAPINPAESDAPSTDVLPEEQAKVLNLTDPAGMAVIRSEKASDALAKSAASLYSALKKATGADYTISDDWVKDPATLDPNAREILIGTTTRPATAELASSLEMGEFVIEVTENGLLIVGSDDNVTCHAIDYFVEHYLSDSPMDDISALPIGPLYTGKIEMTLDNLIASDAELITTTKMVASLPYYVQGGIVTEDCAWMAQSTNSRGVELTTVIKYDTKTWEQLKRVTRVEAGHANDVAYRPDTNEVYLVHSNDQSTVTVLDGDTLSSKGVRSASEYALHTLHYHPGYEKFISCSSTGRLAFYDADLQFEKREVLSKLPSGLLDQSTFATDNYIFYLFAKSNSSQQNCICIYDYEGKFVRQISFPELSDYEFENISIVGDTIYVAAINWSSNKNVKAQSDIFEIHLNIK